MKKRLLLLVLTCTISLFTFSNEASAQIIDATGIDLIRVESPGWFNQIRFRNGEEGKIRHVITDHGVRDRLVIYPGFSGSAKSEVEISGKVAIATIQMPEEVGDRDVSGYRLFVKGGILTEELLIQTGWADYVFGESYNLMSFHALRNFITEEKHLPNMPSEEEVVNDGLELGEITVLQQEKIEEAFLYILELEEKIRALEAEMKALKSSLK